MQIKLKKPSELKENLPTPVEYVYGMGASLACYCPDCGAEHNYFDEWPIDIPIVCNTPNEDGVCKCRFIIPNDISIED